MEESRYLPVTFHLDPNTEPYRMEIYADADQNIRDMLRVFINLEDDRGWSVVDGAGHNVDSMTGDSLKSWTPLHVVYSHAGAALPFLDSWLQSLQSLDIRYFPPFDLANPEIQRQEILIDLDGVPGPIDRWVSAAFTPDGRIWLMGEMRIYCIDIFENQFILHGALDLPRGFSGNGLLSCNELLLIYSRQACFSLSMQTYIETAGNVTWTEFYRSETGEILEIQPGRYDVQILLKRQNAVSVVEKMAGSWRERPLPNRCPNLTSAVFQGNDLIWIDHIRGVFTNANSSLFLDYPGSDHEPIQLKQLPNNGLMVLRGPWLYIIRRNHEGNLELKYRFIVSRPITISLDKNVLTLLRSDNKVQLTLLSHENFMPAPALHERIPILIAQ